MTEEKIRLAIVGCGDVAFRHYLPALEALGDRVRVRALVDPRPGAADRVAEAIAGWSPGAATDTALEAMLRRGGVDAAINLTPAPLHGAVNQAILDAGLHLYSEKPLASSVAEADRLIATAAEQGVRFLCAPGSAATKRFRWLADLIASGRYGSPTLAVAHHADPGPAAWREYTGDPTPFYREGVGPVFDHGVYRLHELTTLLGPVARVQAMGAISSPSRVVRGGPLTGKTIEVTTPDHVLINLAFASGALGQLLASFGTPATKAPWLELHFPMATISFGGQSWDLDAPVSVYQDDDGPDAHEGWLEGVDVPVDERGVVENGVTHFVACLRGEAEPILTAEHARHVLDITLKAYASVADGRSHATETTF
jgi:Predicted dehydrogenases and related proteins